MILLFMLITLEISVFGLIGTVGFIIQSIITKRKLTSILAILITSFFVYCIIFIGIYSSMPSLSWGTLLFGNIFASIFYLAANMFILIFFPKKLKRSNDDDTSWFILAGYAIIGLLISGMVYSIVTLSQTKSTATQIPMTQTSNTKNAPMPEITTSTKTSEMPVVNSTSTVSTQIENSVSDLKNANVYDVDTLRVQLYHGKMVYIAPLDFTGSYWKYRHYGKTDGYFMVDATSKNATPHFVKSNMYYTPNAYLNKDANRVIYAHVAQEAYVIVGSAQLEVNEKGHPYYVSTIMKKRGLSGKYDYNSKGVVTLDAKTGKVVVYRNLKNKPSWLDVAVSPTVVSKQISTWGTDRNGFWNTSAFGSETGVLNSDNDTGTEGSNNELTPIQYKNHIYYFSTMTSANSKQTSAFGYIYTDAATGKSYYFREKSNAMTPGRAKTLANDQMRQTQWKASMPLLYRIDGKPTWIVSMLDSSDAFRSYVYMLASGNGTSSTVATGSDAITALHAYRNLTNVTTASSSSNAKTTHISGTVLRVNIKDNHINFILAGQPDIVYSISFNDETNAQFILPGDKVQFKAKVNQKFGTYVNGLQDSAFK